MSFENQHLRPRFLTVAEVAQMTRLSRATVYRLVQARKIPAVRFGRSYRVAEAAVDEYIARAAMDEDNFPSSNRSP